MVPNERFVQTLVSDLKPVRPVSAATILASTWLCAFAAMGLALGLTFGFATISVRMSDSLPACASVAGSGLTAALASVAAFQLGLPDRSPAWALLPLPALILWISTSTIDCLHPYTADAAQAVAVGGVDNCLMFILATATPLSILFVYLLRSSYPLRPTLASTIFGVAAAAAAATLLNFAHVKAVSTTDMMVHVVAIVLVVSINVAVVSVVAKRRRKASKRFREHNNDATPFPGITHTSKAMEHEHRDPARKRPCATVAVRAHDQGNVVRLNRQSPHGGGWDKSDDP